MSEWQPIESAPKDREIWAFNGEQGRMAWVWGSWVWGNRLLADEDPYPTQPTFWMPLPDPPTTKHQKSVDTS